MNFKLIIISFTAACIGLPACLPEHKLSDKTQIIGAQKIKTQDTKKKESIVKKLISIVPPFAMSGEISDYNLIKRLRDSLFDTHILPGEYKRNTTKEKSFQHYGIKVYKKYFKHIFDTYIPEYSDADQVILKDELKKLEIKLHDSAMTSLRVTPSMANILANYSTNSLFVMTDINDYYLKGAYGTHRQNSVAWTLLRIFIIDLKRGEVIFYKYKIHGWTGVFDYPSTATASLKNMFKEFIK